MYDIRMYQFQLQTDVSACTEMNRNIFEYLPNLDLSQINPCTNICIPKLFIVLEFNGCLTILIFGMPQVL